MSEHVFLSEWEGSHKVLGFDISIAYIGIFIIAILSVLHTCRVLVQVGVCPVLVIVGFVVCCS